MSTTREQIKVVMAGIAEFLCSRGHKAVVHDGGPAKDDEYYDNYCYGVGLANGPAVVLMAEFEGSKWRCSFDSAHYIDLAEPKSLEKIERVVVFCNAAKMGCADCPVSQEDRQ